MLYGQALQHKHSCKIKSPRTISRARGSPRTGPLLQVNKKAIIVDLNPIESILATNNQESSLLNVIRSKSNVENFFEWQAIQDRQAKALILLLEKVLFGET
jgi:hypothetical protein